MKQVCTLLLAILITQFGFGQEYEVVNHSYDGFHDFPQNNYFAEDSEGSIWVLQNGGFTGDVISKYTDGQWESIDFDECGNCTYRILANDEGTIYLATNIAFYAYENGAWVVKSGDIITSLDMDFDSNGNLWFVHNGDGNKLAYMAPNGDVTKIEEVGGTINDLTVADDDVVWFRHDSKIGTVSNSVVSYFDISVNHIELDGNNVAWFVDFSGDIGKIENSNISMDLLQDADNGFQVLSMAIDRRNDLMYLGQQGFDPGIMMADIKTGNSQLVTSEELFPGEIGLIESLFTTSEGNVWAGSRFTTGLAEIQPEIIASTHNELSALEIYPNPASSTITIENNAAISSSLEVYSAAGILLERLKFDAGKNQYDLYKYENGLYIIGNEEIGFQRLMITK